MRLSICIPNFNYGRYIDETIRSALVQLGPDDEVCISDNASSDESVDVIEAIDDERVRLRINATNVGFAANLDRAASLATGDLMLMVSSDDVLLPGAVDAYRSVADHTGYDRVIFGGSIRVTDAAGTRLGRVGGQTWRTTDRDDAASSSTGHAVYTAPAPVVLGRALRTMRNPLHFATTAYPRKLYESVGGYGGHQLVNPDKFFNLKLLAASEQVCFIDEELAAYRWHDSNQAAQEQQSGALKYLLDEYGVTIRLDDDALQVAELERSDVERAFIRHDIGLRGLRLLAQGQRTLARRSVAFGRAAYPAHSRRSAEVWALRLGLLAGAAGTPVARMALNAAQRVWRARELGAEDHRGINATWQSEP